MSAALNVGVTRHAQDRARERLGSKLPIVWWHGIADRARAGTLRVWSYRRKDNRGEVRWRVEAVSVDGVDLDISVCAGVRWRDGVIVDITFTSIWIGDDQNKGAGS